MGRRRERRGEGRGEGKEGRSKGEYTHCSPTNSELRILRHIKIISKEIKC